MKTNPNLYLYESVVKMRPSGLIRKVAVVAAATVCVVSTLLEPSSAGMYVRLLHMYTPLLGQGAMYYLELLLSNHAVDDTRNMSVLYLFSLFTYSTVRHAMLSGILRDWSSCQYHCDSRQ